MTRRNTQKTRTKKSECERRKKKKPEEDEEVEERKRKKRIENFNVNNEYRSKYTLFYTAPDNIHFSEPTYESTYTFLAAAVAAAAQRARLTKSHWLNENYGKPK